MFRFFFILFFITSYTKVSFADLAIEEKLEAPQKLVYSIKDLNEVRKKTADFIARTKVLFEEQKYDQAIETYENALEIIKPYLALEEFNTKYINLLTKISSINNYIGNNEQAITPLLEALIFTKKNSNKQGELYSKIAYIYYKSDLNQSKIYLKKALKIAKKRKSQKQLAEYYHNLIVIYKKLGFLDNADNATLEYKKFNYRITKNIFKLQEKEVSTEYLNNNIIIPKEKNLIKAHYAKIQILDKINGLTYNYKITIGSKLNFKNIEIISKACYKADPQDLPQDVIFLKINEFDLKDKSKKSNAFNGWLFSSSPSLNSVEHPIYDVTLINCYTRSL